MHHYKDYYNDYNDARDDYLSILNSPASADQDQEREKKLRRAKRAMEDAYQDWVSLGNKQEVEDALDTCSRYLAFTPKSVFANAGRSFEHAKDPASGLFPVTCTPSDWAAAPDKLSWTKVIIKQGSSESHIHKDVKQIDSNFSVSFASGLWHAAASGGYHDRIEQINQSSTVDKLGISLELARININRDWFTSALLTYSDATVPGAGKGRICSALWPAPLNANFLPPTAFIVARNINIYNEFSHEEEQFMDEAQSWSASVKIGYGPFSLGNQTSSSHHLTDEEKKEFGSAVKMSVGEGMQIIGYLNTILTPAFPGKDSDPSRLSQLTALGDLAIQT